MNYELFIASRYLRAKRKQAFISVITFISTLGIAIGVMALVIALALITGFQQDVQDKILGATSHIMVTDLSGEGLAGYQDVIAQVRGVKGVQTVSPVIYDMVLISGPYKSKGGMLKGIDFELDKAHSPWLAKLDQGAISEGIAQLVAVLAEGASATDREAGELKLRAETELARIEQKLGSPGFVAKAPPEVVAGARTDRDERATVVARLREHLAHVEAALRNA